jgi:hypothetical protein
MTARSRQAADAFPRRRFRPQAWLAPDGYLAGTA